MKKLQIECNHSKCGIRIQTDAYKTCHHCNVYYCSTQCRQLDWSAHKNDCFIGKLNSSCKRILSKVNRNFLLRNELSKTARTAHLGTLQRGFVWLDFLSEESALEFMSKPIDSNENENNFLIYFGNNLLPKYVCYDPNECLQSKNNITLNLFSNQYIYDLSKHDANDFITFNKLCLEYDPLNEFILLVSVKMDESTHVLRFSKIKFVQENRKEITSLASDTLILTGFKSENSTEVGLEDRRIFLANLLCEFETRGIELRSKFPKLYRDLCLYVEDNTHFTPVCLFPRDLNKNNLFMCLIMPNSEQCNYSWLYDYENEKINSKKNLCNYLYIL